METLVQVVVAPHLLGCDLLAIPALDRILGLKPDLGPPGLEILAREQRCPQPPSPAATAANGAHCQSLLYLTRSESRLAEWCGGRG